MSTLQDMTIDDMANDMERLFKNFSTSTLRQLLAEGKWESHRTLTILTAELARRQREAS